ncbi:MAG: hypothetical protein IPM39_08940 [Chloroflexi bacterium]|nr:hypothetical protein [Chloroflexota bacterium]
MPRQNRVTPFGTMIATSERGLFMGNRGILHNERKEIVTPYQSNRPQGQDRLVCQRITDGQLLISRQPNGRIRPTILLPIHTGQCTQQNRATLLWRKMGQIIFSRNLCPLQHVGILALTQP